LGLNNSVERDSPKEQCIKRVGADVGIKVSQGQYTKGEDGVMLIFGNSESGDVE
jgi:hypothetical protein